MRVPSGRDACRVPVIASKRAGMWICVCKHTYPHPVRGEETDCVFLVYRNTDRTPIPQQLEHTVREHN